MQSTAEILLIDDDSLSRKLVKHILIKANYRVIEAENGEQGVALFQERSPALVLVDALMPELDGFDFCQIIRESPQGKDTPIMMLTSLGDNQSIDKAFQIGVSDFITKPIRTSVLLGRIQHMLKLVDTIQALRDSKAVYQTLVSSLQEVLFHLTPEGNITFVNPAWYKIMGYQSNETIGRNFFDFLHPKEKNHNKTKLQKVLENSNIRSYKTRFITKSGEVRWVNIQVSGKVEKQSPESSGIAGRLYDITKDFYNENYRQLEHIINKIISRSDSIDLTIQYILQAISGNLGFSLAEFWLLDPQKQELKRTVRWHSKQYKIKNSSDVPNSFYLEDWMESVYDITSHISELQSQQEIIKIESDSQSCQTISFKSVQSCILNQSQETLGLMVFFNAKQQKNNNVFSRDLEVLGKQIGQYLKRKQVEKELQQKNNLLQFELNQAARYVESLLPHRTISLTHFSVRIETLFKPSNALGGDIFDYAWLDPENLMFYVLDVSGHGIKSSLLSVSILNILRQQNYTNMDLYEPRIVLDSLNQLFQISESGEDYFTIWYGVLNTESNILKYASAGHPEALLLTPNKQTVDYEIQGLNSGNIAVGLFSDFPFVSAEIKVPKKSRLFLFSDGTYEFFINENKNIFGLQNWRQLILSYARSHSSPDLQFLFQQINHLNYDYELEDDCSIMEIIF
ncbi:SpoIIE family protein phosphatase [Picosynechococcus sp. PCC 73109]|uniref:SpoIIE family protein phosphatase n=1 Tax=Picosynechococcus sp. PCC 73109 TaxID=374982 RepID=UPI0007458BAB|nr:SpoIIE family protein phosphatase [Picosynechococcus sp. PCC 73109]AMA09731.1 two-component response regulator [Picosynechococcus sp. PCC 73109]